MQFKSTEYDAQQHDRYKALTVRQPYADDIARGGKTIEVRSRYTNFRGELLICSAARRGAYGETLCLVELYDVKAAKDFTAAEWDATRIPPSERERYADGYGWMLRNVRRVVEFPVKGSRGFWWYVCPRGEVVEYPRAVALDAEGAALLKDATDEIRRE